MKKILFFVALALVMSSCSDDVVFNNPSVQGLKDNVFWRALQSKAVVSNDGTIVIEALTLKENLTLHLSSVQEKTFLLDNSAVDYVTYTSRESSPEISLTSRNGMGKGKVIVSEYDEVNKTITGTFTFVITIPEAGTQEVKEFYFSQGVFYKVPVSKESTTLIK